MISEYKNLFQNYIYGALLYIYGSCIARIYDQACQTDRSGPVRIRIDCSPCGSVRLDLCLNGPGNPQLGLSNGLESADSRTWTDLDQRILSPFKNGSKRIGPHGPLVRTDLVCGLQIDSRTSSIFFYKKFNLIFLKYLYYIL